MFTRKALVIFGLLMILSMVVAACAPAATPKVVEKTVLVTEIVAGTPVEKIITATPAPVTEAAPEGPIPAEGLVPCNPIPELPTSASVPAPVVAAAPQPRAIPSNFVENPFQATGKVYKVGAFADVISTNWWSANGPENTVWDAYMLPGRIFLYNLSDKYFTFVPWAAKEMPQPLVQEGEKWVATIPIKDTIKWSDGTPFTAKDVAWTANTVLKLGLISGNFGNWYDANYLESMEAVDDYTVKIIYHTKPGVARHEYGVLQAPILQQAFWEPKMAEAGVYASIDALPADASDEQKLAAEQEAQDKLFAIQADGEPVAGGFTLTKREAGAFLEATANPEFFQKGLKVEQWANAAYKDSDGVEVGTPEGDVETSYEFGPFVDSAVYTIYGSQDAAVLALKNGEVDFVLNPLGLQKGLKAQVQSDPNLTWLENSVNGFRYLSFNTRRRPMNDCAFRQAVAVLIDKEFVTQTILQGVAFPNYAFVPPGNAFWYNPDSPRLGEGLSREQRTMLASMILEQAGYKWEGDKKPVWDAEGRAVVAGGRLLMPDGTPVPPLNMPAPSPGYDPLRSTFAIWIETWLNEFGIPVKADLMGFNVELPLVVTEQNFDMFILGWSLTTFPNHLHDFYVCEQAVPDGNNSGGYCNPAFDEQAKQLMTCEDFDTCKSIAFDLQMTLGTELPYVLLFDTGVMEAYRSASVEYPYTVQLSGLQYTHGNSNTLQTLVKVK